MRPFGRDGRIESVFVSKPNFSLTKKRGYYVAEVGYSYSVAGLLNSGFYERDEVQCAVVNAVIRELRRH